MSLLAIGCGLALAVALAGIATGAVEGGLFIAPALVLALPLLTGRYLGAERLTRLAGTRSAARHRPAAAAARRRLDLTLPRGGLLIASSLAVRPPPRVRQVH